MSRTDGLGARTPDRSSPLPLWAQVRDDLARRLAAGEFDEAAGGAFPGEMTLTREYGVSRHTLRQSLQRLRAAGMLSGGRGRPPRVTAPAVIHLDLGALNSLYAAIRDAGLSQRSVVRRLDVVRDPEVAAVLGLSDRSPLVHLERVRYAGEDPIAHDRAWLPAAVTLPLLDADFTDTALYAELGERCGIRLTGGRERVRAVLPTADEREVLGMDSSAAALVIERVGELDGVPMELRRTVVRGDRFSVSAEFSNTQGYRMSPERALAPVADG